MFRGPYVVDCKAVDEVRFSWMAMDRYNLCLPKCRTCSNATMRHSVLVKPLNVDLDLQDSNLGKFAAFHENFQVLFGILAIIPLNLK